jgi:KaiC/GvpD/RAD55 family RecA-like ATPase
MLFPLLTSTTIIAFYFASHASAHNYIYVIKNREYPNDIFKYISSTQDGDYSVTSADE